MNDYENNPSLLLAIRSIKAQVLREAAEDWGDGIEGFPYTWLLERAEEIEAGQEHAAAELESGGAA